MQLPNFIYALGINHVGLSNAKLLCRYYDNDLKKIMEAKAEELVEVEGFGEIIAKAIERYFSHEENISLLNEVLKYVNPTGDAENTAGQKLEGLSFVVTGDVYIYKNRRELQADIERLGGKTTGSVSSKTSYLINNDVNSGSSKNKKAKELGIPIISEQEFIDMIK